MAKVYELTSKGITCETVPADARTIVLTVPEGMRSGEVSKALKQLELEVLRR